MTTSATSVGRHALLDLTTGDTALLCDAVGLRSVLARAAQAGQAQVLHAHFHPFGVGQGVTGVLLLSESHISIHTWPEHGFAAVDIFLCGEARIEAAVVVILAGLRANRHELRVLPRGPDDAT